MFSKLLAVPAVCALATFTCLAPGCGSSSKDGTTINQGGSSSGGKSAAGGAPNIAFGGRVGTSGGNGQGGEGGLCGGDAIDAEPVPANLLFVIDRSQSMEAVPAGFTTSKWEAMVSALKQALEGVRGRMGVGLQFFPDPPTGSSNAGCALPTSGELTVPVGSDDPTIQQIEQKLDGSVPTGSTPTADALALARSYFSSGAGAALEGNKYVLLALDGGPNCNDTLECGADTPAARALCTQTYDKPQLCGESAPFNCCSGQPTGCLDAERVIAEVERLHAAGITTIVVGIPGSEPYAEVLDALAEKGGAAASTRSPKYFKVDDPKSLSDALGALTLNLIKTCELQLKSAPPDENQVNVYLDGTVVPKSGDDGWELDHSTTPPTVRIKGASCAELERVGARSITVEFGCPTIFVPL
ncbi:MAG: vWA domain-containing protein [Myxococcota bacterium]